MVLIFGLGLFMAGVKGGKVLVILILGTGNEDNFASWIVMTEPSFTAGYWPVRGLGVVLGGIKEQRRHARPREGGGATVIGTPFVVIPGTATGTCCRRYHCAAQRYSFIIEARSANANELFRMKQMMLLGARQPVHRRSSFCQAHDRGRQHMLSQYIARAGSRTSDGGSGTRARAPRRPGSSGSRATTTAPVRR